MKKKVKVLCLLMAVSIMATAMAGCGSKAQSTSAGTTSSSGTLEKVIKTKKLIVGTLLDNEPYGSKDTSGKPIGYDVDVANMLAKSLGAEAQIVSLTVPERITALETGKVDVVVGNFTITLERQQKVDFSIPYDAGAAGILVRKDSTIAHAKDLAGKKVGVTKGSTDQTSCENLIKSGVAINMVLFDNGDDEETALKNKQIEAIIGDSPYCAFKGMKYSDIFKYVGTPDEMCMNPWYNSLGVKKGDQEWLNYINQFVFQINTDGTNKAAYVKWFGKPVGIPLNPSEN